MLIDKYVGKTVLLNISEEFASKNDNLIQSELDTRLLYANIVDHDDYGLWVENSNWVTFPKDGGPSISHVINFVIPWHHIISIAAFPDRDFQKYKINEEKGISYIGFKS